MHTEPFGARLGPGGIVDHRDRLSRLRTRKGVQRARCLDLLSLRGGELEPADPTPGARATRPEYVVPADEHAVRAEHAPSQAHPGDHLVAAAPAVCNAENDAEHVAHRFSFVTGRAAGSSPRSCHLGRAFDVRGTEAGRVLVIQAVPVLTWREPLDP